MSTQTKFEPGPALAPWYHWMVPYREFEKIAYKILDNPNAITMPGAEKRIADAVENLYAQHKGEPAWDEAYRRWHTWDDEYPVDESSPILK